MEKSYRILVINPGSTSTKISLFENEKDLLTKSLTHSEKDLEPFQHISDQHAFRTQIIEAFLGDNEIEINSLDAVVGRGGLLRPIPGGTYAVNETMLQDLNEAVRGEHASNLGAIIAYDIGKDADVPVFIVDPVVVDEMEPLARLSGHPDFERRSILHALNQKAVARKASVDLSKKYEEVNLIVAHLGGGISVGVHKKGRIVDVNNALNGDGPFSPERAGGIPAAQLIEFCYMNKYTETQLKKRLVGQGGMVAYLGTNDMRKVQDQVDQSDKNASLYYEAMAYQVAKEIGLLATVVNGKLDGIVLTGGLAFDPTFVNWIRQRTEWISPVLVYPGEEEMKALALGALRVLSGLEEAKIY